jgi:hypothetical protein
MITREQASFLDNHADDLYGLWEAGWHFDSIASSMPRDRQRTFLAELVGEGLVDVFRTSSVVERGGPLAPALAVEIVKEPRNWLPPPEGFEGELYYIKESAKGAGVRRTHYPNL